MNAKQRTTPASVDPRLAPGTETPELTPGGSYVDGKLVHTTEPRAAHDEADRHGKAV